MAEGKSIADVGYRIVLTPHYETNDSMTSEEKAYISSLNRDIEFDYISSTSITSNTELTTYPLVNGDTISDHMQIEPKSIRLGGSFSLNGSRPSSFITYSNDRLTNIQTYFEKLQKDAVFCTLTTMSRNEQNKQRFVSRDNLVLQNITWTENQNSLDFDFTFTEVQTIEVEQPTLTPEDSYSPNIYSPSTLSFTEQYHVFDNTLEWCVQTLLECGCLTPSFVIYSVEYGKSEGYETYLSDYFYNEIYATLSSTPTKSYIYNDGTSYTYEVSNVVGQVGEKYLSGEIYDVIATPIQRWFADLFDGNSFPHFYLTVGNEDENQRNAEEFLEFLAEIYTFVYDTLDDIIKVYGIASNSDQTLIASINNTYYQFEFTRNNTNSNYGLTIYDTSDNVIATYPDISNKAIISFSSISGNNSLIKDTIKNNVWVYLINYKLAAVQTSITASTVKTIQQDLTSYQILVSNMNLTNAKEKFEESILTFMETQ